MRSFGLAPYLSSLTSSLKLFSPIPHSCCWTTRAIHHATFVWPLIFLVGPSVWKTQTHTSLPLSHYLLMVPGCNLADTSSRMLSPAPSLWPMCSLVYGTPSAAWIPTASGFLLCLCSGTLDYNCLLIYLSSPLPCGLF